MQFEKLPSSVQKYLKYTWSEDYKIHPGGFPNFKQFINHRKKIAILRTPYIEANTPVKAAENANEVVESSLNPLRILNSTDFTVREYYFLVKNSSSVEVGYTSTVLQEYPNIPYYRENDIWVDKFNSVLTLPRNQLDKKIANGIRMYGTAASIRQLDVKFTLLVSALEALLLTGNDRDYLGWKLSERTAFLISLPIKRKETYCKVTELYSKRSRFVHQDEKFVKITFVDFQKIEGIIIEVIRKLFDLREQGYTGFKADNSHSITQYLEKLKFVGVVDPNYNSGSHDSK